MIYYNLNTINDWNFGDDNIIKVYKHGAVCYYKITSGDTPTPVQEPCYAVVDDITQYSDREFDDVFDKATEKWYKLNNLNQYEQYGIYGSGRTSCEGSTSRLPQGYTEVEYIENTSSAYINTNLILLENIGDSFEIKVKTYFTPYGNDFEYLFGTEQTSAPYTGIQLRYYRRNLQYNSDSNVVWTHIDNGDGTSGVTASCSSINATNGGNPLTLFCGLWSTGPWRFGRGKIYSFKVTKNDTLVRDLVPCKRDSDNKYGMYDLITDTFYLSPNSVDFSGGEPIAPTDCVTTYEGKLTIDDGYEYIYSSGSWVNLGEVSGSTATLPNVSFVLNYNAKNYDATTHSIPQTSGQTKGIDAICNYNPNNIVDHSSDGYISVTGNTRLTISGGTTSLARSNNQTGCTMTIVSKARTDNVNESYSIITNRGSYSDMNWMWRYPANGIFLHGSTSYNKVTYYTPTSASPITASVRVSWDGSVKQQINDWTNNGSYSGAFQYGSTSNSGAMFCDYLRENAEFWKGDFYWVYMSHEVLTDEQIQQVIAYNENGGGEIEYPVYYDEIQDPPNNLTFSSMTEAESYECPWVGMKATIASDKYVFSGDSQSGYEWVYNPSRLPVGYTEVEYIENTSTAYIDTNFKPNQDTRIVLTVQCVTSTSYGRYIGAGDYNAVNAIQFDYESGAQGTLHVSWGHLNSWTVYSNCVGDYGEHTYDWDKNYFYRDKGETNQFSASTTYTAFQCVANLGIFCHIYNNGSAPTSQNEFLKGKLYTFKMYDNGTLIRDLVPCKRDSDDKYGMYDIVNDVFYTSPNGNNFIGGDPV